MEDFQFIVGLKLEDAEKQVQKPFFLSADSIDGITFCKTSDFNLNRINIVVKNNIITEITGIG